MKNIIFILLAVFILAAGCTSRYRAHETGVELSKEMTDVIQAGLIGKAVYDTLKTWRVDLCRVEALDADQCARFDNYLRIFNMALTYYGTETVRWYKIESDPDRTETISAEFAGNLIWGMWHDRENLVAAVGGVVGDNFNIPELRAMNAILKKYPEPQK